MSLFGVYIDSPPELMSEMVVAILQVRGSSRCECCDVFRLFFAFYFRWFLLLKRKTGYLLRPRIWSTKMSPATMAPRRFDSTTPNILMTTHLHGSFTSALRYSMKR